MSHSSRWLRAECPQAIVHRLGATLTLRAVAALAVALADPQSAFPPPCTAPQTAPSLAETGTVP